MRCADLSAGESLAGTATVASRFLIVEHRGRWGRDPLDDETALSGVARAAAEGFDGRVLLARRPDRRDGPPAAFVGDTGSRVLSSGLPGNRVERLDGLLFLVCTHGRRDRCCAQRGVPVFDALAPHVDSERLWQSSHHGGHRFAANVLVLPHGIQLGRVEPEEARDMAATLLDGRIPLEHFRGRTLDSARVQAADVAVRQALSLDRIGDVQPLGDDGSTVEMDTPSGVVRAVVTEEAGPLLPVSCGAQPESTTRLAVHVEYPA